MNTAQTWQIDCIGLEATIELAATIGKNLRGGEVIELASDLGGGKTAFVRGLAKGMGSSDSVRSPSFTISNQYRAGKLTLYHFDFYRLSEAGIMRQELAEIVDDLQAVVAIEWSDIVQNVLPDKRLSITIKATGEASRQFSFRYSNSMQYLLTTLKANT